MAGINKVILIGHLGQEPESRTFQSGDSVTNISVATSESWKDKQTGEKREATEWHRVAIFGPLANIAAQYLRKGSKVYLEGKLRTRKWQGQDGQDRYTTEVVLQGPGATMQMLSSRSEAAQGGFASPPKQRAAVTQSAAQGAASAPPVGADGFNPDEDTPF